MKFRKKPVVIDAVQLRWDTWNEICDFCGVGKLSDGKPEGCYIDPETGIPIPEDAVANRNEIGIVIPTLEGMMVGRQNDWIIKGVNGEFYPCKPDIFEKTYEPFDETVGVVDIKLPESLYVLPPPVNYEEHVASAYRYGDKYICGADKYIEDQRSQSTRKPDAIGQYPLTPKECYDDVNKGMDDMISDANHKGHSNSEGVDEVHE